MERNVVANIPTPVSAFADTADRILWLRSGILDGDSKDYEQFFDLLSGFELNRILRASEACTVDNTGGRIACLSPPSPLPPPALSDTSRTHGLPHDQYRAYV